MESSDFCSHAERGSARHLRCSSLSFNCEWSHHKQETCIDRRIFLIAWFLSEQTTFDSGRLARSIESAARVGRVGKGLVELRDGSTAKDASNKRSHSPTARCIHLAKLLQSISAFAGHYFAMESRNKIHFSVISLRRRTTMPLDFRFDKANSQSLLSAIHNNEPFLPPSGHWQTDSQLQVAGALLFAAHCRWCEASGLSPSIQAKDVQEPRSKEFLRDALAAIFFHAFLAGEVYSGDYDNVFASVVTGSVWSDGDGQERAEFTDESYR